MSATVKCEVCEVCGFKAHVLLPHLREKHGLGAQEYTEKYPGSRVFSAFGAEVLKARTMGTDDDAPPEGKWVTKTVEKLFGFAGEEFECRVNLRPGPNVPVGDDDGYVYPYNATMALLFALHRERRNSVWLAGYSGTGKTQLVLNVARKLGREVFRLTMDASTTVPGVLGDWVVRSGETRFQYGPLTRAMKRGAILLVDEFDQANPFVAPVFRPVNEDWPSVMINDNGGEVIRPVGGFCLVATANTFGTGDNTSLYGTTQVLSLADRQRFSIFVEVDYLVKDEERSLLIRNVEGLEMKDAMEIVMIASSIRSQYKERKIEESISPRQLVNWAELYVASGNAVTSANMAFLLPLSMPTQVAIRQLIEESGLPTGKV